MAKAYLYKGIHVYRSWGTWQADYVASNGNRFALHRCCCSTKADAEVIAKAEVDYLNEREV